MKQRNVAGRAIALLLVTILLLPAAAVAVADPLVPPVLHQIAVTANGKTLTYAMSSTPRMADGSSIDTAAVTAGVKAWVTNVAPKFAKPAVNATRKLNAKKRRVDFKAGRNGNKVDQNAAVAAITARMLAEANETTPSAAPLALPLYSVKPKIGGFKYTILVVQSRRKIYLYHYTKVLKTYRCAVGQPRYPTPNGSFFIGKKVKNPSWTNGGMQWAANMPSYIGPSPNNPLGTRAMYVYGKNGDTGVRFHGVPPSENSSIGHAASHGCLRMHRKDVEDFFKRVSVGTTVYIIR